MRARVCGISTVHQTMIFISLLATMGVITLARASSYASYRRRELPVDERPALLLLYDQRGLENRDSSPRYDLERDYGNGISLHDISNVPSESAVSRLARDKKLGLSRNSLSIVNPVDVLRQRVLLELARRKAMQDQRQVDANRRMLETIGKRSVQEIDQGYPRTISPSHNSNDHIYTTDRLNDEAHEQTYTQRIPIERTREWYNVDDTVIRENGEDDTRKVLTNYHHDRM